MQWLLSLLFAAGRIWQPRSLVPHRQTSGHSSEAFLTASTKQISRNAAHLMAKTKNDDSTRGVRLDKWLWAARFFRTRSLAQAAIDGGKVDAGGDRAKPSRMVTLGMELTINCPRGLMTVIVEILSEQRKSGTEAATLYRETEESKQARIKLATLHRLSATPAPKERPNTQDRKRLRRIKEG